MVLRLCNLIISDEVCWQGLSNDIILKWCRTGQCCRVPAVPWRLDYGISNTSDLCMYMCRTHLSYAWCALVNRIEIHREPGPELRKSRCPQQQEYLHSLMCFHVITERTEVCSQSLVSKDALCKRVNRLVGLAVIYLSGHMSQHRPTRPSQGLLFQANS